MAGAKETVASEATAATEIRAPAWLRRARELLHDTGLDGPRSVREIAGQLGVHPVYLARRFRQSFGMTPGEYLRHRRLARAHWLLRRTSAGLAEIAAATGFTDQSHFSNAFRKWFGVSPGVYRGLPAGMIRSRSATASPPS